MHSTFVRVRRSTNKYIYVYGLYQDRIDGWLELGRCEMRARKLDAISVFGQAQIDRRESDGRIDGHVSSLSLILGNAFPRRKDGLKSIVAVSHFGNLTAILFSVCFSRFFGRRRRDHQKGFDREGDDHVAATDRRDRLSSSKGAEKKIKALFREGDKENLRGPTEKIESG